MNEYLILQLKKGRLDKGLKQSDVTKLIGIKNTTLSNYENGITEPDIDTFLQLCELYNLNYATLLAEAYGFNVPGTDFKIKPSEMEHIEKYRALDLPGQNIVDTILNLEVERSNQARGAANTTAHLQQQLALRAIPSRFFAYYGRIAAAGTSVEFSDIAAGIRAYPETEVNKHADYVVGVSGDSMEPEYHDGDIVYVQKTDHVNTGEVVIFQKGNRIYIKKAGKNDPIFLNSKYPPLNNDGNRITVLGKVLGKAEEN